MILDYELYHHGVKGMRWGVRKKISAASQNVKRLGRAISAANIEESRMRIERSLARNKDLQKRNNRDYRQQNARYRAKLKRLNATYNSKVSDLSDVDINRGRSAYKTMKNVSMSVAITAASTAIGAVSMPAGVATKLVGAGLNSVLNSVDVDS